MELKNMSKEELELLSYTDLTDLILKENKKPMNTPIIFHTICNLLGYSDEEYTNKIGDFYTALTTDKRFVLLESAEWDLKDNHVIPLIIDDDEEMDSGIDEEEIEEDIEEDDSEIEADDDSVIDDDLDDDIDELEIIADDNLDEENELS